MGYKEIYQESNELAEERFELVMERIAEIAQVQDVLEQYQDYFQKTSVYLLKLAELLKKEKDGTLAKRSMEECQADNLALYEDIFPGQYEKSYANPVYAVKTLGEEYGQLLSMLYVTIRQAVRDVFAGKKMNVTIRAELFVEIYNYFEEKDGIDKKSVEQAVYWFFHDYSEVFVGENVSEIVNPEEDFMLRIVMDSDLKDLRYLYRYGDCIGSNELGVAEFLNTFSDADIQAMAATYTEGYRIGFETTGKDLGKKMAAQVRYPIGFERMVRAAGNIFEVMG